MDPRLIKIVRSVENQDYVEARNTFDQVVLERISDRIEEIRPEVCRRQFESKPPKRK